MAKRFIAHPPGTQDTDTYRQFVDLQTVLADLEDRLERAGVTINSGDGRLPDNRAKVPD